MSICDLACVPVRPCLFLPFSVLLKLQSTGWHGRRFYLWVAAIPKTDDHLFHQSRVSSRDSLYVQSTEVKYLFERLKKIRIESKRYENRTRTCSVHEASNRHRIGCVDNLDSFEISSQFLLPTSTMVRT